MVDNAYEPKHFNQDYGQFILIALILCGVLLVTAIYSIIDGVQLGAGYLLPFVVPFVFLCIGFYTKAKTDRIKEEGDERQGEVLEIRMISGRMGYTIMKIDVEGDIYWAYNGIKGRPMYDVGEKATVYLYGNSLGLYTDIATEEKRKAD